jgi:hypothetical protein
MDYRELLCHQHDPLPMGTQLREVKEKLETISPALAQESRYVPQFLLLSVTLD